MSTARIVQQPIIIDKSGKTVFPELVKMPSEAWLQKLLPTCPEILPTAEIDSRYAKLFYIASEVATESTKIGKGHIDILYLSTNGNLVIVETKLYRNPESSRQVIGQVLDYAVSLHDTKQWNWDKLESIYKGKDLYSDIKRKYPEITSKENFIEKANESIRQADFLMMIVGDAIRPSADKIAEFINSPIDMHHRLALCELTTYKMADKFLVVPRLTTSTNILERAVITLKDSKIIATETKQQQATESEYKYFQISMEDFISDFTNKNTQITPDMLSAFFDALHSAGFSTKTATKQVSIGIPGVVSLFQISTDSIWFTPSKLQATLKSPKAKPALSYLLESLKDFLIKGQNPYKVMNKFYRLDFSVINTKRTEFISALSKFKEIV